LAIRYSSPRDLSADHKATATYTAKQLDKVNHQIQVLEDAAKRDVYDSVPRLKLPPLRHLRAALESQLRQQRGHAYGGTAGKDDTPAYSSGSIWRGDDR
jgi:hypothetical protein